MASKAKNDDSGIDLEEVLGELEHKIDRLKVLYEQYFMGIEKIEPQTARKEVARKLIDLSQLNIRNTAMRYRFHALNQKFGSYQTYWMRTLREIENGTYYRSIARASREAARKGVEVPDELMRSLPKRLRERIRKDREIIAARASAGLPPVPGARAGGTRPPSPRPTLPELGDERDDQSFEQTFDQLFDSMTSGGGVPIPLPEERTTRDAPRRGPPTVPPAAGTRPPPGSGGGRALPPGMDEEKVRELHRRFVAARQALGDHAEVRYEQILATVAKQGPKILEQHGARAVEFGVVVKDGKVILKATPRK